LQQVRGRLRDFLFQFDPRGVNLLSRGRQRDFAANGFAFLHELPSRLQIAQQTRIDRILRELSLRQSS